MGKKARRRGGGAENGATPPATYTPTRNEKEAGEVVSFVE